MTTTTEIATRAGVSFRQVDYWVRSELVPGRVDALGAGSPRAFTSDQVKFIVLMGTLVNAGMKPDKASEMVKLLVKKGEVVLNDKIKVALV